MFATYFLVATAVPGVGTIAVTGDLLEPFWPSRRVHLFDDCR
jgi:hypothetical protein